MANQEEQLQDMAKLALIGKAARALAEVCDAFDCTIDTALPMIIDLAGKELGK